MVSNAGYARNSFINGLADYQEGNIGYTLPKNWAFDQFYELKGQERIKCKDGSFNLDKDAFSGRDVGIITAE
jgi:peptidoglycan hydrolase-like protein with peptidoglycan-binding domain